MSEHCSQTLALNAGSLQAVRLRLSNAPTYPDGMQCAMRIQVRSRARFKATQTHKISQGIIYAHV